MSKSTRRAERALQCKRDMAKGRPYKTKSRRVWDDGGHVTLKGYGRLIMTDKLSTRDLHPVPSSGKKLRLMEQSIATTKDGEYIARPRRLKMPEKRGGVMRHDKFKHGKVLRIGVWANTVDTERANVRDIDPKTGESRLGFAKDWAI